MKSTSCTTVGDEFGSEDSNIVTFFQSFDFSTFIISPSRDLSQTVAKIELILKEPANFDDLDAVAQEIGFLYNLILYLISIVELCPNLCLDFHDHFKAKIPLIFSRIFTSRMFSFLYRMNEKHIDVIWQIHRLVCLIFSVHVRSIVSDSTFLLPTKLTILILRCLQLPIFRCLATDDDIRINTVLTGSSSHPSDLFRGRIQHTFIVRQKLSLLQETVTEVLNNCKIDKRLLQYLQEMVDEPPAYFSYNSFAQQAAIVARRCYGDPNLKHDATLQKVSKLVEQSLAECHYPPSTVLLRSKSPKSLEAGHYQFHVDQYQNKEVPEWVKYFEENHSLVETPSAAVSNGSAQQTYPEDVNAPLVVSEGFRTKFKLALGIPVQTDPEKRKRRWLF
jgi:hypothetical protein